MSDKEHIKKEMKKLASQIESHNYKYYVLDEPTVSDKEYDDLLKKLTELEEKFPALADVNSPTQRVGIKLPSGTKTVRHRAKMYSLDNTYNIEELRKWHDRVLKGAGAKEVTYMAELKIDGLSAALLYEKG